MIQIRPRHGKYTAIPHEFHNVGELARILPRWFQFSGNALILEDGVLLPPETAVKEGGQYTFLRCWPAHITRRLEFNDTKKDDRPEFQFRPGVGLPYQNQLKEFQLRLAAWEARQKVVVRVYPEWECVVPGLDEIEQALLPPDPEGMTLNVY